MDVLSSKTRELKRAYYSLSARERVMVNAMLAVVLFALVYVVLVYPASRAVNQAQLDYEQKQNLLAWMKSEEGKMKAVAASGLGTKPKKTGQALMTQVNRSAQQAGLTLKRYEPDGEDKLRVWLDDVSFNKTIRWLNQLESRDGIKVINISIDAQNKPGIANFKIILGS